MGEAAADELARGDAKDSGPSAFDLAVAGARRDRWALERWREYEHAVHGLHRTQWSRHLRARLSACARS